MPDERKLFEPMIPASGGVETPPQLEAAQERAVEQTADVAAPRATQRVQVHVSPKAVAPAEPPVLSPKSEVLRNIESVMEDHVADAYKQMPPDLQLAFKKKGEETAREIESMLYKVKVHTKKIFQLIFTWLKIIPGVNQYFLEQEAKLKTDEIMRIKEDFDRQRSETKTL